MEEQFGDQQSYYNGDVNDNGIPVEDKEYAAIHPLYKPIFVIVTTKLSETAVKAAARDNEIYYYPINEDNNSQRNYYFEWKNIYFPKLQRDVAKYFTDQDDGINQLSEYYVDGDEEIEAEDEVEEEEFDDELEKYAPKDDALVEEVDGLTSTVQFKPIEKLDLNKKQSIALDGNDESTTNEDNSTAFDSCGDGGFDTDSQESNTFFGGKDILDTSNLKEGIHQSTVGNALNASKLGREEDSNTFKELADDKFATQRANTNPSPTSVDDTAVFNSTSAAKVDSKLEDVLLGRHTDGTTSNTDQVVSLYPEGIEMHPHQEDMHYGKRNTRLLNCDYDEYDILRRFGRDRTVFPISKASLRHNRHIKSILFEFGPKAAQVIIDADLARDLHTIDLSSIPAASRRGKFGILYALYNKDGILIKIGITFNVDKRNEEYRKEFEDYDENYKMIELVAFDSIPLDVEQELSKLLCEFMDSVIENKTTPTGLRLFVINLRERGWHRGGEKVHWIIQLCEVGFQLYYKLPYQTIMGEAFMWDQQKCKDHCNKAMAVAESLVSMIGGFEATTCIETGKTLPMQYERSAISTWAPGESDGIISSFQAHIQHIIGDSGTYQNVIDKALYPGAKTVEKRFATNFPIDWYMHGLNSFVIQLEVLFCNRNDGVIRLVLVDAQDFMFGNLFEPQRLIITIGFVYCGEELGGEIIVYRAGNVVLYLHGMPSLASDPRKQIPMERKQLRAIALDGMKGSMDLITEDLPFIEEMTVCNILGSLFAENIIRGGHGDGLLASAVQRDMLMPDGKNAIDRFRGSLTIHDIMYPCTRAARRQWKELGGPVMSVDWWLEAETQKEALAKRHPLPFNREGAMSLFKAGIRSLHGTLSKEKRAKGLEWQRRKEEAEFFEHYGMGREEANRKYDESPQQYAHEQAVRAHRKEAEEKKKRRQAKTKAVDTALEALSKAGANNSDKCKRTTKLRTDKEREDKKAKKRKLEDTAPVPKDLYSLSVAQLKDRLRDLNLTVGGRKHELICRLNKATRVVPKKAKVVNTSLEALLGI